MKILYVVNNAAFFCSHRLPIALAARRAGHQVSLVTGRAGSPTLESGARNELTLHAIEHHELSFSSSGMHPWHELRGLFGLVQRMRSFRPDVVHCASPKGLLYGGMAARLAGVPGLVLAISGMGTLFTVGGGRVRKVARRLYSALVRWAYGHPNCRVIVQNLDDEQAVLRARWAAEGRVTLIPGSGVSLGPYLALPIEGRQPLVVLPARLLKSKGVREFVAAASQLRQAGSGWRFALVGTADYVNPDAIDEPQIRAWERAGAIEWWGHQTDMTQVLGQARIVCLPSYREGMPKALLEAAAAGCAVVTTDATGCREAIEPGRTGDLVPVGDSVELAQVLQRLMDDPARCTTYGLAGRQRALERFDLTAVVRQTLEIYDELASRP